MSPREAADATGIHKLTILRWIRSGKLPAEEVITSNGKGYDIRPEDLTHAISVPRKKKEAIPSPPRGSVVAELEAMRLLIQQQGEAAAKREEDLTSEIKDLRGQLHQTEARITEILRALPAPAKEPRTGIMGRIFKRGKQ